MESIQQREACGKKNCRAKGDKKGGSKKEGERVDGRKEERGQGSEKEEEKFTQPHLPPSLRLFFLIGLVRIWLLNHPHSSCELHSTIQMILSCIGLFILRANVQNKEMSIITQVRIPKGCWMQRPFHQIRVASLVAIILL